MQRHHLFLLGIAAIVGGCIAVEALEGDDPPEGGVGTRNACGEWRDIQADPPADSEVIQVMLDIARFDTTASVHSAALNLADQLETGSSADIQQATERMNAACEVSGL